MTHYKTLPSFIQEFLSSTPDSASSYFRYCVAAHFTSVATLVPTDVDQAIRKKLWESCPGDLAAEEMTATVLETKSWDITSVSSRFVRTPLGVLSGHDGERLSILAAAYGYWKKRASDKNIKILGDAIFEEVSREWEIAKTALSGGDGGLLLRVSTLIAHNLGDLDRVLDIWGNKEGDGVFDKVGRLGHPESQKKWERVFWIMGELNKKLMANENHRHLALREVRSLRRLPSGMVPIGPFFDGWGEVQGRSTDLLPTEKVEIIKALYSGWEKILKLLKVETLGYPRAVTGILGSFPGGRGELYRYLPQKTIRDISEGHFNELQGRSEAEFRASYEKRAWRAVEAIRQG
jgi:hypothetical protein